MEAFWRDLRYSIRALLKRPAFSATVVITLALGIGANATIFAWIKAVLLAPLPGIQRPERLVEIWGATRNNFALSSSYLDYLDFRDRNVVLSGLAAHQVQPLNLGRGEKPERVWGAVVSGNYFNVLGVRALIGRTFLPEEDRTPKSHPVVVIGYGLWQRYFGTDPKVIGRTITLNEHNFTIIGVTSEGVWQPVPWNRTGCMGTGDDEGLCGAPTFFPNRPWQPLAHGDGPAQARRNSGAGASEFRRNRAAFGEDVPPDE